MTLKTTRAPGALQHSGRRQPPRRKRGRQGPAARYPRGPQRLKAQWLRRLGVLPETLSIMHRGASELAAITCLLLCLAGCGHTPEDHGQHESGHAGHAFGLQLTLNEGEKWPVDEHTRVSAARLTELVGDSEPLLSVEDARTLAEELDEELDSLVKGCTMTGRAHEQLHVFLVALFPKVEELKTRTDVEDLRIARAEIGALLAAYEEHFE